VAEDAVHLEVENFRIGVQFAMDARRLHGIGQIVRGPHD